MKILYIGHYKEGSGWSQAAINNILALDSVGIDVVCRNIKLTNYQPNINPKILMLENKNLQNVDVCIQHVLPHHIVGSTKFKKNIAYFAGESNTLKHNIWLNYLKLVTEVWVPNSDLRDNLIFDGLTNVKVIPHAFDLKEINQFTISNINFGHNNYKYKFYYIGELNDRKNLESIIRSFHSEFDRNEQVALVLKVKKFGISNSDLSQHLSNICGNIKKELRLYNHIDKYHKEIIISDDASRDQILAIHNSCDCFVSPSHGEGWSIPAFEAMCLGKTPICSNEGGPKDFISKDTNVGWLVDGCYNICNHDDPAFNILFTGNEEWFCPSESEIKKAMRFYYENRNNIDRKAGLKHADKFSHINVGNLMKDALNV